LKKSNWTLASTFVIVLALLAVFGIHSDSVSNRPLQASAVDVISKPADVDAVMVQPLTDKDSYAASETSSEQRYFAKYDGIPGESGGPPVEVSNPGWIDILSIHWGGRNGSAVNGGASGRAIVRPVLNDFELTFLYDKAEPKLEEACLKGKVILKLEVELYETVIGPDGVPVTTRYLRYEFKNVLITSFDVSGKIESGQRPTATITNAFGEVMVNYYNSSGQPEVAYSWSLMTSR
jgi:type VI secretion system secreted protein Hcp